MNKETSLLQRIASHGLLGVVAIALTLVMPSALAVEPVKTTPSKGASADNPGLNGIESGTNLISLNFQIHILLILPH